jgi:hypothetical protein
MSISSSARYYLVPEIFVVLDGFTAGVYHTHFELRKYEAAFSPASTDFSDLGRASVTSLEVQSIR